MIIQCDFDGTIIENNISVILRQKYAYGDWENIDSDYLQGNLSVEQSNKLQFALIKETRETLQELILQNIEVRPGFAKFLSYCRESKIRFVIVSSGLDFYIETVLDHIGMSDLELKCGQTKFKKKKGIEVYYTSPAGKKIDRGFKVECLNWLKNDDDDILYIGDGLSDVEAARQASRIFAIGHLPRYLDAQSIPYSTYTDFHDLKKQISQA